MRVSLILTLFQYSDSCIAEVPTHSVYYRRGFFFFCHVHCIKTVPIEQKLLYESFLVEQN